jgi:hypothetical protein
MAESSVQPRIFVSPTVVPVAQQSEERWPPLSILASACSSGTSRLWTRHDRIFDSGARRLPAPLRHSR